MNEEKVHLKPLISKTFAFKDYLKAYQYIDDNRETTMKVIINVQEKIRQKSAEAIGGSEQKWESAIHQ